MPLEYAICLNMESIIVCISAEELHFMSLASGSFLDLGTGGKERERQCIRKKMKSGID